MNIAENLNRIQEAKENIKTAIQAKGVAVSDDAKIDEYPLFINNISSGEDTLVKLMKNELTEYNIPDGVTKINQYQFYSATTLTSVTIPDSVTSIGNSAFTFCNHLINVKLSNNLTAIPNYAFFSANTLSSIEIPSSVKTIGDAAFYYCDGLKSVTFNEGLQSIGASGFSTYNNTGTTLESVTFPSTLRTIGAKAFETCKALTSVTMNEGLTTIGASAFSACRNLKEITFPDSVTSIGGSIFNGCISLSSMTIGSGVTSLPYLFVESNKLGNIYCKGAVSPTLTANTFFVNYSGGTIHTPQGMSENYSSWLTGNYGLANKNWTIVDDLPPYIPQNQLVCHYNVTTTSSGTKIKSNASILSGNTVWINDGPLPKRITSTAYTFTQLGDNTVKFDNTTVISGSAFAACQNLTSVEIPNSVTSIGTYAFQSCANLTSVVWDSSQQFIQNQTFTGCTALQVIDFSGGATQVMRFGSSATSTTVGTASYIPTTVQYIVVPDNLYDDWKASTYWSAYTDKIISKSDYDAL